MTYSVKMSASKLESLDRCCRMTGKESGSYIIMKLIAEQTLAKSGLLNLLGF